MPGVLRVPLSKRVGIFWLLFTARVAAGSSHHQGGQFKTFGDIEQNPVPWRSQQTFVAWCGKETDSHGLHVDLHHTRSLGGVNQQRHPSLFCQVADFGERRTVPVTFEQWERTISLVSGRRRLARSRGLRKPLRSQGIRVIDDPPVFRPSGVAGKQNCAPWFLAHGMVAGSEHSGDCQVQRLCCAAGECQAGRVFDPEQLGQAFPCLENDSGRIQAPVVAASPGWASISRRA